jgi:predicted acyl esterase
MCLLVTALCLPKEAHSQTFTEMVEMRDGTRLATDVYLPSGTGPFAVVLSRTPYSRDGLAGWAAELTPFGVVVVAQDMRGRLV